MTRQTLSVPVAPAQEPENTKECGTCRYWDLGICRKHSAKLDPDTGKGRWPVTVDYDWCGDWRRK